MDPTVSTLIAVLIGALIPFISSWLARKSEERRHYRELAVRVAISKWEIETKMNLEVAKTGQMPTATPLDAILIHSIKLMEIAQDTSMSKDEMIAKLSDLGESTNAAINFMKGKKE